MHDRFYVVNLRGDEPREVLANLIPQQDYHTDSAAWESGTESNVSDGTTFGRCGRQVRSFEILLMAVFRL